MAAGVIVYLDTSAFLKLYRSEPESDAVRGLLAASTLLCTHLITYVEMRAALAKAVRMGHLVKLVEQLDSDWETLRVVVPDSPMIRRAGELAEQFELRGYDSVHLAAAETVFNAVRGVDYRMAVYDGELVAAANSLGIPVFGSH